MSQAHAETDTKTRQSRAEKMNIALDYLHKPEVMGMVKAHVFQNFLRRHPEIELMCIDRVADPLNYAS